MEVGPDDLDADREAARGHADRDDRRREVAGTGRSHPAVDLPVRAPARLGLHDSGGDGALWSWWMATHGIKGRSRMAERR
jgi:hypothetical protein